MGLLRQFQVCFLFFYEKILSIKKTPKRKQMTFTLLEVFVHAKNCYLCRLMSGFCARKIFSKKINK